MKARTAGTGSSAGQPGPGIPERPLAIAFPRRAEGALLFELGRREYRVEGDVELIEGVLAHCDGTRLCEEIGDSCDRPQGEVEECLGVLARYGLVVPADEAYRHLHELSGIRSPLHRPRSEAEIEELMRSPRWSPTGRGTTVPMTDAAPAVERKSAAGRLGAPTFEQLCGMLAAMYGVGEGGHCAVPSAGALYPLTFHVSAARPIGPLGPGLWWFDWERRELVEVEPGGAGEPVDLFFPDPLLEELLAGGAATIFLSADIARTARKYGPRAYRYVLMEAGAAMGAAYRHAAEAEIGIRAIGGIDEEAVERHLGLPEHVSALMGLVLGRFP